jgi:hypothetical protein
VVDVSAHTRCDECRAEAPSQPFRLKGSCPEVEVCSWTCLAALVARKIKDRAIWDAKLEASLKAQSPVDDVSASGGQMESHSDKCKETVNSSRCDRPEGHAGKHSCEALDDFPGILRREWL